MQKKYTLSDLHASDTDQALRAEMIAAKAIKVCRPDPELSVVPREMVLDIGLIMSGQMVARAVRYE